MTAVLMVNPPPGVKAPNTSILHHPGKIFVHLRISYRGQFQEVLCRGTSLQVGRRPACDAFGSIAWGMWRHDVRPPSDSGNAN
jgi:hypothetical protein